MTVAALAAALGVGFVDELADGTKGAALPLIRGGFGLTYGQIGLLIAIPLLVGSLLELPFGLIAGNGRRRQWLVLGGGTAFIVTLAAVATARSFGVLMAALVLFFPASGAFVGLTQSALMDADLGRQQQRMAAWNLAGSMGAVAGPLLLVVVLSAGGGWRTGYLLLAALAGLALAGAAICGPPRTAPASDDNAEDDQRPTIRQAVGALREADVLRWAVLLEISDLLLDVLTGFVGVYLVDVVHASPAQAAFGVAIRLGAGLAGDAAFVLISRRASGPAALRLTGIATMLLYPAFLLVPGLAAKLIILAVVSAATACWYPVIQTGLYGSLHGRSGIAVFLGSAAGLAGAAGPLAVGFVAQQAGLTWAMASLAVAPVAVLVALPRRRRASGRASGRPAVRRRRSERSPRVTAARDPAARDLAARDLAAQDLAAQDLAARDPAAQDLPAQDPGRRDPGRRDAAPPPDDGLG
ncbi:MAG TPA: MFS transporter [Streptosporangiaceae bacterium]|nr:MFS transporter [Streptosporangiaceae bacterium]